MHQFPGNRFLIEENISVIHTWTQALFSEEFYEDLHAYTTGKACDVSETQCQNENIICVDLSKISSYKHYIVVKEINYTRITRILTIPTALKVLCSPPKSQGGK